MKSIAVLIAAAFALSGALAAQPGPRGDRPCTAAAGASAPAQGCAGPMAGPGARSGQRYTQGWSMMTPQERAAHREKLAGIKSYDECQSYMEKHREDMAERAKAQGHAMPAKARHDACAPLKTAK